MTRVRTIYFLGLLLLQTIVYGQNYDDNPYLNGYANDVNVFLSDQQKQNQINEESNVFLNHVVSSRAAQFSGPQYLPPVENQQLICSGQEICVRKNYCQNGYFSSQDLNRDQRQDCDYNTEVCCSFKPPVKPSTPCSGNNYACVSPNQCSNGEITIIGFKKPQSASDKCFAPEICCRVPIPESTVLQDDGYVLRTPENPLTVPERPRPQQPRPQPTPQQPRQPIPQQPRQPIPQQPRQPIPQQPRQPTPQPRPRPQPTPQQPRPQPIPQQPRQPVPQPSRPQPTPQQPRLPTPQQPRQPTPQPQRPTPQQPRQPIPQQPRQPIPQQPRQPIPQQPRPQPSRPQPIPTFQPQIPSRPQQPRIPTTSGPEYLPPKNDNLPEPQQPSFPPQPTRPQPRPQPKPQQPYQPQTPQPRPQQPYQPQPTQPRPQQPYQPQPTQPRPQQPYQPQPQPSRPQKPYKPQEPATYLPPTSRPQQTVRPDRGEGILSEPIRPPPIPPITSNDISELQVPSACAAALNCTQVEYCTATGDISDSPVNLSPEQELFRVPLTDCYNPEKGFYGKCCRDLTYTDPWPVNQLGQYRGIDFGDDGSYKPEQVRNRRAKNPKSNQVKRGVTTDNVSPIEKVSYKAKGKCSARNLNATPLGTEPNHAAFSMYPWQAMVLLESTKSLLCGGVIIADDVVATAAHCVQGRKPYDVLIKGGEWKLGRDEEPITFQLSRAKTIEIHPEYDANNLHNDFALLHLDSKLKFDIHIGALCLDGSDPQATDECYTTGWGKFPLKVHLQDAIMHHSAVQYLSRDQCDQVDETKVCGKPAIDACDLDPGSALACTNGDGKYFMKGLYSSEDQCGNSVILFAKPDLAWINQSFKNNGKTLVL